MFGYDQADAHLAREPRASHSDRPNLVSVDKIEGCFAVIG
jgi:hypothetical protein